MQADPALAGPAVTSIPELLDRMLAIDGLLPRTDGLACFNRMYRLVTQAVQDQLQASWFGDQVWMSHLDVVFGNLYLAAVTTSVEQPDQVPRAWAPLLERRSDARVAPLQFALAGMNAHINHDLPLAVVTTSDDLATTPAAAPHPADYEHVNAILAAVEPSVRAFFEDELLRRLDQAANGLEDVVANFDLATARRAAWISAQTLWALRQTSPDLAAGYLAGLDRLVGFAGRGLLVALSASPGSSLVVGAQPA